MHPTTRRALDNHVLPRTGRPCPSRTAPPAAPHLPPGHSRGGIQFHLGHGEWIKILRESGFVIDGLHELYAPPGAPDHPYYTLANAEWARQWPAEEIWAAHLAG